MPGINQNLFDSQVMHAAYLQRAYSSISNSFNPYLSRIGKIVKELLDVPGDKITGKRQLNSILSSAKKQITNEFKDWNKEQRELIYSLIDNELSYQFGIHKKESARLDGPSFVESSQDSAEEMYNETDMILKGSAVSVQDATQEFSDNETNRILSLISGGAIAGLTTNEIYRSITGTSQNKFRDGALATTLRNNESVTKTISSHATTSAQVSFLRAQRSVAGYEIVATLDVKTSDICKSLDGKIILKDADFFLTPPFHHRCRSVTVAIFTDSSGMVTGTSKSRAARGSTGGTTVKGNVTYYEWLKTQPAWFQDDALGKEKGKIFRNSGLSTEEFRKVSVNRFYDPLTISEMANKDKRIMDYIS